MRITILTPSYNYARFIGDMISSVKHQSTSAEISLIVQDAGSTDDTESVVRSFADGLTVNFIAEPDAGQSDALNRALEHASDADVIGWLNADEFYLADALQKVQNAFVENPDAVVVYGDCAFVDEAGNLIRLVPAHRFSTTALKHYGCFISSCATFMSARSIRKVRWDTRFRRAMDWDLWLSLSRTGKFVYIPEVLSAFRVHGAQVTNVPESEDAPEFELLRQKHQIRTNGLMRAVGRGVHMARKLSDGAYGRQFKSLGKRGSTMTWWA